MRWTNIASDVPQDNQRKLHASLLKVPLEGVQVGHVLVAAIRTVELHVCKDHDDLPSPSAAGVHLLERLEHEPHAGVEVSAPSPRLPVQTVGHCGKVDNIVPGAKDRWKLVPAQVSSTKQSETSMMT